ncbi:hypothetical protein CONLIGDRAFT_278342 [Coniochaeta ligniaria NRRL 30616]|uniref:Uncharacterized protein n=1 Tax=Coniochaeta ligniaria NRRL 30616 TaxID=1408157 RepID=A0A1J7I4A1_9PEZI|nr:hypothetical protein CONLIGDRAFT_278342 [Coniochaeta ligniaria NRRL 30616]
MLRDGLDRKIPGFASTRSSARVSRLATTSGATLLTATTAETVALPILPPSASRTVPNKGVDFLSGLFTLKKPDCEGWAFQY